MAKATDKQIKEAWELLGKGENLPSGLRYVPGDREPIQTYTEADAKEDARLGAVGATLDRPLVTVTG